LGRFSREYAANGSLSGVFNELQQELMDASKDIVRLSHQLGPATIGGLPLSAALRSLCQQATDGKRAVFFIQNEGLPPLSDDVSQSLYRIAQESLQNALTHSGANYICVELSVSATAVRLSVKDNGCGFVVGSDRKSGLGLSGMSERMKTAGGVFKIISNPGEGTAVVATMPLTRSMRVSSTA
jgi:signal transduction histidine kinase